jgi:hypothetical protein
MFQDGLDDLPILDGADDPHGSPAFRTGHIPCTTWRVKGNASNSASSAAHNSPQ